MNQTSQATADWRFNVAAEDTSVDEAATQRILLSSTEAAVKMALGSTGFEQENGLRGEVSATESRADNFRSHTWNRRVASKVPGLPPAPMHTQRMVAFHALQEWEGHVVSIDDDAFVARLVDVTASLAHESEEATIPLDELSEHDATNMAVGRIFRWVIGYERSPEGTRKRVSQIVFRDLPRMTEDDLRAGTEWANHVAPLLNP